jgi:hypothetical protein
MMIAVSGLRVGPVVLNGLLRAPVETGETARAAVMPMRTTIGKGDVPDGTDLGTEGAAVAVIASEKAAILIGRTEKGPSVDDLRKKAPALPRRRRTISATECLGDVIEGLLSPVGERTTLLSCRRIAQGGIIARHGDMEDRLNGNGPVGKQSFGESRCSERQARAVEQKIKGATRLDFDAGEKGSDHGGKAEGMDGKDETHSPSRDPDGRLSEEGHVDHLSRRQAACQPFGKGKTVARRGVDVKPVQNDHLPVFAPGIPASVRPTASRPPGEA